MRGWATASPIMSDTPSLSVVGLLEELHQVADWYMLGVYLGLPREELSHIESQFHGLRRCKTEMFDLWLRSSPNASWDQIALALEKCGEKVLARRIHELHPVTPSVCAVPTDRCQQVEESSLIVEVDKAVVDRFTALEDKFAILVTNIMTALEEKQISLKNLQRFLKQRLEQRGEYMQATSIDELFQQISPHYCFLNTTLLKSIVNKFIGEPLMHQLKDYRNQLDEFTTSTKVVLLEKDPLKQRIQSQRPPNTEGMPQVVLKLAGCCLHVTIEHFQKLVNKIFGAMASALTHIRVEDGCICISWLTRESAIPSLVALARKKVEFMRHVGVLRLTVSNVTILENKRGYEEVSDLSPALLRATTSGCVEAVEFLLTLGADPNYASEDGATPLIFACKKGSVTIAKVLLNATANVNQQDSEGKTALVIVCDSQVPREDLVKLLLLFGADTHSSKGWTALTYATRRGHTNVVQLLLNERAAVNAQTSTGVTALMCACSCNHPDIVQLLLSNGADPNLQDKSNGTALNRACLRQLTSVVELLLAYGADPNLRNEGGSTSLMFACCDNIRAMDPSIPVLLLSAGANPNAVSNCGYTALTTAASSGYYHGIEALLTANANVNVQSEDGFTALHFAAQEGHLSITELLLAAGASAFLVNKNGQTALDLALAGNHHDVCQLLLMHMGSEPPLIISETEHSPHTHQIQIQPQQRISNRFPHHPLVQQLHEILRHPLSPVGTFKHWEDDEEEEKMDIMKSADV